jgi:tetratricopeptide (TPR) repeat protein
MTQPNVDVTSFEQTGNDLTDSKILAYQAEAMFKEGNFAKAASLFAEALAKREKAIGAGNPLSGELMDGLAQSLDAQGMHAEAEKTWRQGIELLTKAYYEHHHSLAPLLDHLGNSLVNQARFEDAEPVIDQAMTVHQKTQRMDHPDLLCSTLTMAKLQIKLGKAASALPLLKKAIMQAEKHAWAPIGDFYFCQARAFLLDDKVDDTDAAFKKAVDAYAQRCSYASLVTCLADYGQFLKANGRNEESDLVERRRQLVAGKK